MQPPQRRRGSPSRTGTGTLSAQSPLDPVAASTRFASLEHPRWLARGADPLRAAPREAEVSHEPHQGAAPYRGDVSHPQTRETFSFVLLFLPQNKPFLTSSTLYSSMVLCEPEHGLNGQEPKSTGAEQGSCGPTPLQAHAESIITMR